MYAIRNKKTGKWLYGTDSRYSPKRQRTSFDVVRTYATKLDAEIDLKVRKCGKEYAVVKIRVEEVK